MINPNPLPYLFPGTQERDADIRKRVGTRLGEFSSDNVDTFTEERPGMQPVKGRELLAFYRSKDLLWWEAQARISMPKARAQLLGYAGLVRHYGGLKGGFDAGQV